MVIKRRPFFTENRNFIYSIWEPLGDELTYHSSSRSLSSPPVDVVTRVHGVGGGVVSE